VFLLWDDEDKDCLNALAYAKEAGITCLDLTDGLNALTASEGIKADKPISVPEAEESPEEEYETEEEDEADETDESDEEDEEDESDEEDELYEEVYLGLEAIAKLIAKAVVAELNASKKAKKAPRK
jgi:ABC-type Zn2+ transport system substrate-binding protein/surface adhesin